MALNSELSRQAQAGTVLLVVHEFVARSPDELSLFKGDRIELIERDDDFGDGWYLGRHVQNGSTGLFPEVYTTPAPKSTLVGHGQKTARGGSGTIQPVASTLRYPTASDSVQSQFNGASSPSEMTRSPTSARSPHLSQSASPNIPQHPVHGTGIRGSNQNSAVMNETLSVIDEHITNMHQPSPGATKLRRDSNYSGSEYSGHADSSRQSYIQGTETEEEEQNGHTEIEVSSWSPARVAEHLEDIGVEPAHCKVLMEQEFSGEVLLAMEQQTIFLKELELGPIGRRLKTWQKIKSLQEEVRAASNARAPTTPIARSTPIPDASPGSSQRSSLASASVFPRITPMTPHHLNRGDSSASSTLQPHTRPSAASIRSLGHSRRHSSLDNREDTGPGVHLKQASFDQSWTMGAAAGNRTSVPARPNSSTHIYSASADRAAFDKSTQSTSSLIANTPDELDRGYLSGGDLDRRRPRRTSNKRDGSENNRHSTHGSEKRLSLFTRSSRTESVVKNGDGGFVPAGSSPQNNETGGRIVSEPLSTLTTAQVTGDANKNNDGSNEESTPTKVQSQSQTTTDSMIAAGRKGLRAISDAVTRRERATVRTPVDNSSHAAQSPTRTEESSTPSANSTSMEYDDIAKQKVAAANTLALSSGTKRKAKKQTSAYIRGLESKSPAQQMEGCDYSGWMKKKSSNLMTTWKPRLFVLRGRRLSYFYADNDTEEKGLIDISGHRVLPADNERITGLHATLTGATSSPTSPQVGTSGSSPTSPQIGSDGTASAGASPITTSGTSKESSTGFIFKLVPPRSGLSKAVNFTKPTVHYFWVSTLQDGRLWMAALMKATIDRDDSKPVTTSYNQKTISLAKARARKERPPALMMEGVVEADDEEKTPATNTEGASPQTDLQREDTVSDDDPSSMQGPVYSASMEPTLAGQEYTESPISVRDPLAETGLSRAGLDEQESVVKQPNDQIDHADIENVKSMPSGTSVRSSTEPKFEAQDLERAERQNQGPPERIASQVNLPAIHNESSSPIDQTLASSPPNRLEDERSPVLSMTQLGTTAPDSSAVASPSSQSLQALEPTQTNTDGSGSDGTPSIKAAVPRPKLSTVSSFDGRASNFSQSTAGFVERASEDTIDVQNRDQITEVTNLERRPDGSGLYKVTSAGSRRSRSDSTRRKMSFTRQSGRSNSGSSSAKGLGIGGLDASNRSPHSRDVSKDSGPIIDKMQSAGLW